MDLGFVSPRALSLLSSPSSSSSCSPSYGSVGIRPRDRLCGAKIRASSEGSGERISGDHRRRSPPAMEVSPSSSSSAAAAAAAAAASSSSSSASSSTSSSSVIDRSFRSSDSEFPLWEKLGAVVRLSYGVGIYGAMAMAGKFICSITGIDWMGGFHPSLTAIVEGLGYAAPPIMALLFILDDEVVKYSPHARAIRDVEDEELRSFFYGMSPWQFNWRGALLSSCCSAFAAVITAALTGSLYYVATAPKDPTYVVTAVSSHSRSSRNDLKKLFAAWYERRQMKKIYSPLLEGLLALYLGFEWIQTDNILSPMITHGIYSAVVLGHGLWKIHDHRRRLRNRIQQLRAEARN
ncbi:hypothetical protein ACMD2_01312 [Ananas comosus]|uniref:Uncharacterized protein n=1 Tax=Ananas comosus TaxID=4615 RepID=A0A199VA22_ANACO|nr:hypothetical protein ACMD2_01312 [Ananas comosus]